MDAIPRVAARLSTVVAAAGLWAALAGCGDPKIEVNSELSAVRHFTDAGTSPPTVQAWLEHRGYKCVAEPEQLATDARTVQPAAHWTLCTSKLHHDLACGYYVEVHVVPEQAPSHRISAVSEEVCL